MNWKDNLPKALLPHTDALAATELPCIRLTIADHAPAHAWDSAIGHIRYWPQAATWPTDENGRPLFGLLQLNLATLPVWEGFPSVGILQFFVNDNAFWGANPLEPQRQANFRVVYHDHPEPAATPLLTDFSFLPQFEDLPLAQGVHRAIVGQADTMPMPPEDCRFPELLEPLFAELGDDMWPALAAYRRAIGTVGHRLGGYAGFVQDDPRTDTSPWELLLQLDTDTSVGMRWGDYGVAHWFHQPAPTTRSLDAHAAPFQSVWYAWEAS